MNDAEAYSLFVKGLKPELRREIGTWVDVNDLDRAKAVALKADAYTSQAQPIKEEKADKKGWGGRRRKGAVANVETTEKQKDTKKQVQGKMMTQNEVNALVAKQKKEWEKERNRAENERNRERNLRDRSRRNAGPSNRQEGPGACYWCKGPHHIRVCPVIRQMREATQGGASSSGHQQGNA